MTTITPVRALTDNYVYIVQGTGTAAAVVDPGESAPVEAALARLGLTLGEIWCTHHHRDHTGGIEDLLAAHPGTPVVASRVDAVKIATVTRHLDDGDRFDFAGMTVEAIMIPGHTLGAVALRIGDEVFTGDTLFGACCGRIFEGTPEMMQASLARLRALPDTTRFWCGHEYTLGCLKFAATVEPENQALTERLARVAKDPTGWTVPLSILEERATNPMLRWDAPAVVQAMGAEGDVNVFAAVRRTKDGWRG
jgi:hydroxyacylglutathione hydrolase